MKTLYGTALIALLSIAGGCVSIGSDGPPLSGRLLPVGEDAADFARSRGLALDEDMGRLQESQAILDEQKNYALADVRAYQNRSAGAWNDPHFLPQERAWAAGAYGGLAQESQMRSDRYRLLMDSYDGRRGFLTAERNTANSDAEKYDNMRLVAP